MTTQKIYAMNVAQKKIVCLFFVLLTLTMPFTYAASISSVTIRGDAGVANFVGEVDTAVYSVTIDGVDSSTNASDVAQNVLARSSTGGYIPFETCVRVANQFTCTITREVNAVSGSNSQATVEVFYNNSGTLVPFQHTFYIDRVAPTIENVQLQQVANELEVTYRIRDRVHQSSLGSVCSGLAQIRIYYDDDMFFTQDVDPSQECLQEGVFTVPLNDISSGTHLFQVQAVDRIGLESTKSGSQVEIDRTPPTISEPAFIIDSLAPVTFIGVRPLDVQLQFESEGASSVTAYVDAAQEGELREVSLTRSATTYTSSPITLSQARTYTIRIVSVDSFGNTQDEEFTQTIRFDDQSNRVTSLTSNVNSQGLQFITRDAEITAEFEISGSGFEQNNIRLDVDGSAFSPQTCEVVSTNRWRCVWTTSSSFGLSGSQEREVSVRLTGPDGSPRDDAGNTVDTSALASTRFIYDTQPPRYTGMSAIRFDSVDAQSGLVTSFATLEFELYYSDISPVTAHVDMSQLGGNQNIVVPCSDGVCQVNTGRIGPGPYNERFSFRLVDELGNEIQRTSDERLEVLQSITNEDLQRMIDEEGLTVFTHNLRLRPSALEASTSRYMSQRAFAEVSLSAVSGEVLSSRLLSCRGINDEPNQRTLSENPEIDILTRQRSTNDFSYVQRVNTIQTDNPEVVLFDVTFKRQEITNNESVMFFCDIQLHGTYGDLFVSDGIVPVLLNFSVYNFALGTLDERYKSELESARDSASGHIAKKLDWLRQIFEIARLLCQLYSVLVTIMDVTGWGGHSLKVVAETGVTGPFSALPFGVGTQLQCLGQHMGGTGTRTLSSTFEGACQFVNCEFSMTGALWGSTFGDSGFLEGGRAGSILDFETDDVQTDFRYTGGNKDNLITSTLNLCIPGIIANLENHRQIQCKYVLCLENDVPQGVPMEACKAQKSYAECAFITGGIAEFLLNYIPLVRYLSSFRNMISDPLGAVGLGVAGICAINCGETSQTYWACELVESAQKVSRVFNVFNSIMGAIDYFDSEQNLNYCEEAGL